MKTLTLMFSPSPPISLHVPSSLFVLSLSPHFTSPSFVFVCSETPLLRLVINSCSYFKVLFKHFFFFPELGPFDLDGANYTSMDGNQMVVNQTGIYYVYGQVHYIHLTTGGLYNRCQLQINNVTFRVLQKGMDGRADIGNVYSGGMALLNAGDKIRLITQTQANINMNPKVTFFGAFRVGFGCHESGHHHDH